MARLRRDLPLYSKSCLVVRAKDATVKPLVFNEAQTIVHQKISEQRKRTGRVRAVVLKARQEGVSTYTAARFFRRMNLWPATVSMVVADQLERCGVLYDIYNRFYDNLPLDIRPKKESHKRQRYLKFSHDSELSVRPASDAEAGRAMTINQLHASELAYWGTDVYATWISLMQAVPHDGSEIIVESTAKGAGGFFHELWEQAESGENGWLPIFLPWWIHSEYELPVSAETRDIILSHPDEFERLALSEGLFYEGKNHVLSLEKLAWRRAVIVERFGGDRERLGRDAVRGFMQEFPATAEEAFLVSGSCFFDEDVLRRMARTSGEAFRRGLLVDDGGVVRLSPSDRGFVRIYEDPQEGKHYVIGADTAEGKLVAQRQAADSSVAERGGRDYSAAVVYEVTDRRVVAELHGRIVPEVFADQLRLLARVYPCGGTWDDDVQKLPLLGVERSHSSGQTVLRLLNEHYHYPRLYYKRDLNKRTKRLTTTMGWVTSDETRMPMLDELAALVRKDVVDVSSKDLVREMVTFVTWPDGKPMAEEGCHDDRVIALAIAIQMAREHRHAYERIIDDPEVTDTPTGM